MRFTPLNDLIRPPKHKVTNTWLLILGIATVFVIIALFMLNPLIQLIILRSFQWRQYIAGTGYFWLYSLLYQVIVFVLVLIMVILIVLYVTLAERKLIAYFQVRQGPNRAGPWGILQPFADMFKILIKEDITPLAADKWVYNLAPLLIFLPTLLVFAVMPLTKGYVEMDHRTVPLDTPADRELHEDWHGYNILDITFAKNTKQKNVKKKPDLENNIQLALGADFIARTTRSIGATTIYTTPNIKRAYDEYEGPDKPPPPRLGSELSYLEFTGQGIPVRTTDGKHILWLKPEASSTTDGDAEKEILENYSLHFFTPEDNKFIVEQTDNGNILLTAGNTVKTLALDGDPFTFDLGDEKLKVRWQTTQTYSFYLIPRDINIGVLFIVAITSLAVIVIFMAGWGSNNKWSLFGAMRSAAQMISYEVPMGLSLLGVVMMAGTTSMVGLVEAQKGLWFVVPQFLGFLIYFTCSIAEVNRCPFDLPEAESELVGGFHTEYTGLKFGFFFLAEYANMFIVAALATVIFFGGWYGPGFLDDWTVSLFGRFTSGLIWFFLKSWLFVAVLIWIRSTFPRLRVDHVMEFAWKVLIPLALLNLLYTGFFTFSDWRLTPWLHNQWLIRENYIYAIFRYPNYILSVPLLIAVFLLIATDIRGRYKEIKARHEVVWSPPDEVRDVPALRHEAKEIKDEYDYTHKGFQFGKWLRGSETEKDVPGYKEDQDDGH